MSSKNVSFVVKKGNPFPLGPTPDKNGFNFSIVATKTEKVTLVVDSLQAFQPVHEIVLEGTAHQTGDIWHVYLETDLEELAYGFRVIRNDESDKKILIDPYSKFLKPRKWGDASEYGEAPCCITKKILSQTDPEIINPPKIPLSDTIIYELHTRGFTQNNNSEVKFRGSFRGIIEKIPYLKSLGVTTVELLPITAFDENDNRFFHPETGEKLKNFWGYNPVSFFAVHQPYGKSEATAEFKELVNALHENNMEIILDMVFNHTGEGDLEGVATSFRVLADEIYYMQNSDKEYANYTGCGNTLNTNHPIVQDLIIDSLRYWAVEMKVDGFRFDLASIFNRKKDGQVTAEAAIVDRINSDPVLKKVKLIAEAWDASGLYQVGSFSADSRWHEWNGKYRDDVRRFLSGFSNSIQNLATRIAGSSDLYHGKSPLNSINFLTSHDGFTLYDFMSYEAKHNFFNGENNRDGDNHNFSWNSGFEGEVLKGENGEIQELRLRRIRTAFVILLLSQGIPMLTAGDEFGRSQSGNNNCWCQDNETSWLDWTLLERNKELFEFVASCINLRREHKLFRRNTFFSMESNDALEEISWQYLKPNEQNWDADCLALGFHLKTEKRNNEFFIILNGNREKTLEFILPQTEKGWYEIINTTFYQSEQQEPRSSGAAIAVAAMSGVVLRSINA